MQLYRGARIFRWQRHAGADATPVRKPLLAVADNGDGTGGVATITGSAPQSTNTLYYTSWGGLGGAFDWTSYGARVSDGTIAVGLPPGAYFFQVVSVKNGATALPSNLVELSFTGPTTPASTFLGALTAYFKGSAVYPYFSASGGLWVEEVPEEQSLPLLILHHNGETPEQTTELDYEETADIQFELFAVGLARAEALALVLKKAFDPLDVDSSGLKLANGKIYNLSRTGYKVSTVEGRDRNQQKVYQITIPYTARVKKTLGLS